MVFILDQKSVAVARYNLITAVLRSLSSERSEPHAHYDAELEYCDEMILEAANALVAADAYEAEKS